MNTRLSYTDRILETIDGLAQVETPPCPFCGKTSTFPLSDWEVTNLDNGALIHDVLPHFTRETREQMISGIDPNCWTQTFGN